MLRASLRSFCSCVVALAALVCSAQGETLTFPEANFSVEVPDGWSREDIKSAAGPKVNFREPDGKRSINLIAIKSLGGAANSPRFLKSVYEGGRRGAARARPDTLQEGVVQVAGLQFFTASGVLTDGSSSVGWYAAAGEWVYSVLTHGPKDDEALAKVQQSFRLLQPAAGVTGFAPEKYVAKNPYEPPSWFEQNFRAIYIIGGTIALFVGGWIMDAWKKSRRRAGG